MPGIRETIMMHKISWFHVLLLYVVICLDGNPAEAMDTARVSAFMGDVQFRQGKTAPYRPIIAAMPLPIGVTVKTGANGWAKLELSDGSTLNLGNRTELELSSLTSSKTRKKGRFTITAGKIRANISKLAGQQIDFRFKSATAVAGVKGTEFLMLTEGAANVFFGVEGVVTINGVGRNSKQQPLASGSMVQTTRGSAPDAATIVDREPALVEARALFAKATGSKPPDDWRDIDRLPDMLARWNVNYGHYLADQGNFDQALTVFQIAIDLSHVADIRADAWLERGTVHSRHLKNPRAALAEYLLVLEEYPQLPQAETALFMTGQILAELGLTDQAETRFRQYLQTYPLGRYRSNVELLLRQMKQNM